MKSYLIIALTMVVSLFSSSQNLITVTYAKSEVLSVKGQKDYSDVISNGDIVNSFKTNEMKVIDLDSMQTRYYQDGNFVKTFKIVDCQEKDGVYVLTYNEKDSRNGNLVKTKQIINTKTKESFYYWYWDGEDDASFVIQEKKLKMKTN